MNQPRYYAGEFDDERRMSGAFTVVMLIIGATVTHGVMLWCGIQIGHAEAREEQRLAAAQPKRTSSVIKADWSQFDCRELVNICRKRYEAKR